jgi:hypothetical protein
MAGSFTQRNVRDVGRPKTFRPKDRGRRFVAPLGGVKFYSVAEKILRIVIEEKLFAPYGFHV